MSPPSWAYQLDGFEPPADEELVCSVCHCVFCDPVQSQCNHVFCRQCITKWMETSRNCPICRKRGLRVQEVIPLIRNMILKLTLHCHNSEKGCDAKVTLEACETHIKVCPFEVVVCPNAPCSEVVLRKDLQDHETNDCLHRCVKCSNCGLKYSVEVPAFHNCVQALLSLLEESTRVIKDGKLKIEKLEKQVQKLKAKKRQHSLSSSADSLASEIIPLDYLTRSSSSSSVSTSSIFSDTDEPESPLSPRLGQSRFEDLVFGNLESMFSNSQNNTPPFADSSIEYPRESTPGLGDVLDLPGAASGEDSPIRRPPKRRLPSFFQDSSDEEGPNAEPSSLPSPKRAWHRRYGGNGSSNPSLDSPRSGIDGAGPSSSRSVDGFDFPVEDDVMVQVQMSADGSASPGNSQAPVPLESTLSMLSRYNLESEPDCLVVSDSDSDYNPSLLSPISSVFSSDSDSSSSDFSISLRRNGLSPKVNRLFSSSDDDDPDYEPN